MHHVAVYPRWDQVRGWAPEPSPRAPAAEQLLGFELRPLVAVAKALPHVEVLLTKAPCVFTGHIRGGDVGQAPQTAACLTALRELEHPSGALHIDLARSLEPELEGDRRRAVHDLTHPPRERIALLDIDTGARQVTTHRDHAIAIRVVRTKQGAQRTCNPSRNRVIIRAPHKRIHTTIGALQITRKQLHPDEPS